MSQPTPSQKKIPLWVQMLTGGIAGSIAEVIFFKTLILMYRLQQFPSIQQRLDYKFKVVK